MAWKSSLTLCAVLAEVSKNSNPHSSAYAWAVYRDVCMYVNQIASCVSRPEFAQIKPWFRWLVLPPDQTCCRLTQWQYWGLLDVVVRSPRLLLFPRKTMQVSSATAMPLPPHNRHSRPVWYHKQRLHNWHCDSTWEPNSCIFLDRPCPFLSCHVSAKDHFVYIKGLPDLKLYDCVVIQCHCLRQKSSCTCTVSYCDGRWLDTHIPPIVLSLYSSKWSFTKRMTKLVLPCVKCQHGVHACSFG